MQSKILAFIATGALLGAVTSCGEKQVSRFASQTQTSSFVYVKVRNTILTKEWVQATGFNRDHAKNADFALGWLPASVYNELSFKDRSGVQLVDERAVSEGRLNPFTMEKIVSKYDELTAGEDYHNYQALTDELRNLADGHPELARLTSLGKSTQGRDLWMMTISDNVDSDEQEPKLLYIANMHGDEVVGRELSIYHIRRLLQEYGTNERVTNLVNNSKIYIVPSMNPDGFELHQRYSARNIDLNRNFPDFTSDDRDTPANRAVETGAIMELHNQHHFIAAVNFHGGEVCFNLPWDTKPNRNVSDKFGDDAVINSMGRAWADSNPTMEANNGFDRGLTYGYEWYEVDGGMQDWSIWYRRSMHATVELSYTKWPSASYLPTAWRENQEAMLAYHERALTGVHLEVVDSQGQPIPSFELSVDTANRTIRYDHGVAHRTTTPGPQKVTVSINGRAVATVTTAARAFDGRLDRVVIAK